MTNELQSAPTEIDDLRAEVANLAWDNETLRETLTALEYQLDADGWTTLSQSLDAEFSREALRKINALVRLYWLKNPLIQRGVNVQSYYVFGQGVEIAAQDADVNDVVQYFLDDAKNQAELTSQQALMMKEAELTLFGNVYFVFFVKAGRVRVRTIPETEIDDIITNPEDAKDPWWYKRVYSVRQDDGRHQPKVTYYKDWRYTGSDKPTDGEIAAEPVYHVKVGGLSDMRFGVSEVYAALDWAKAYKQFLADWATIVRAYSRFAWQLTVKTKAGIATAKAKLSTTIGSSGSTETNPPPVTGSTFIGQEGVGMQPIRTAGATTSAEDGRRLLLMVASSMGVPESFFGDVSVGTLATARSLDRPTELKFVARQSLWGDVLQDICDYVVYQAVKARILPGTITEEDDGTPLVTLPAGEDGKERDATVSVTFPPILEHDVASTVESIVKAATLGGSAMAQTIDPMTVSRLLLTALGVEDVDAVMETIYPPDPVTGEPTMPEPPAPEPVPGEEPEDDGDDPAPMDDDEPIVQAARRFRAEMERLLVGA